MKDSNHWQSSKRSPAGGHDSPAIDVINIADAVPGIAIYFGAFLMLCDLSCTDIHRFLAADGNDTSHDNCWTDHNCLILTSYPHQT